eukprot:scaffold248465_cov30-Cyclotella_meneghiniana.AAC.1
MDHMPAGRFSQITLGQKIWSLTSISLEVGDLTIIMCRMAGTKQPMDTRVMNGFCTSVALHLVLIIGNFLKVLTTQA